MMIWIFIVGALGALTLLGSKNTAHLEAGRRYRFSWSVTPAVAGAELTNAVAALTSSGALDVTIDGSSDQTKTSGSYTMVASETKDLILNEPQAVLLGHSLVFTNVENA